MRYTVTIHYRKRPFYTADGVEASTKSQASLIALGWAKSEGFTQTPKKFTVQLER